MSDGRRRDEIWNVSFETYYDSYYQELVAEGLSGRWSNLDLFTKVLVALTASGSAVAGWHFWTLPGLKLVWVVIAGFGAVVSTLHASVGVSSHAKRWSEAKGRFAGLRLDLETLRYQMRCDPDFNIDKFWALFERMRERYKTSCQHTDHDILRTLGFRQRCQQTLNAKLRGSNWIKEGES